MNQTKENFNNTHPELKKGERFLTNSLESGIEKLKSNFGAENIRTGRQAYTIYGEPAKNLIPVFVKKSEVRGK